MADSSNSSLFPPSRRCSSELLLLNNHDCIRNELNASVAAVVPRVKLAVVVEIVSPVELASTAELT